MNKEIEYTNAPEEVAESLDRAKIIPNFLPLINKMGELKIAL